MNPATLGRAVGKRAYEDGVGVLDISGSLDARPGLNRTNQTVVNLLAGYAGAGGHAAVQRLTETLKKNEYFRGVRNYAGEALLGLSATHFAPLVEREYIRVLKDMPSRVEHPPGMPTTEEAPESGKCLIDVLPSFEPIDISSNTMADLRALVQGETRHNVDLYRSAMWALARSSSGVETAFELLADEHDQKNAYYLARFAKRYLPDQRLVELPGIAQTARTLRRRWPQNRAIADFDRRATRLLQSA